jgi:hypothetical protein
LQRFPHNIGAGGDFYAAKEGSFRCRAGGSRIFSCLGNWFARAGARGDGDAHDYRHDLRFLSLENHEAVVKFDPERVKVEDLIKAVKEARGMNAYEGKVKKK